MCLVKSDAVQMIPQCISAQPAAAAGPELQVPQRCLLSREFHCHHPKAAIIKHKCVSQVIKRVIIVWG